MTALYGHSQDLAAALPLVQRIRPAWWKAIDPAPGPAAAVAALGTRLLCRHFVEVNEWTPRSLSDPDRAAFDFWMACRGQGWYGPAWGVETPNEPVTNPNAFDVATYARFEAECVRLFASDGKECVVGNLGSGQDGHAVEGARWYGAHEYGWPELLSQAGDHALRYRRWFGVIVAAEPDARLLITECGVTRAVVEWVPPGTDFSMGWRSDGRSAEDYWERSLAPYLVVLDHYVEAAFLFQVGGFQPWASFECLQEAYIEERLGFLPIQPPAADATWWQEAAMRLTKGYPAELRRSRGPRLTRRRVIADEIDEIGQRIAEAFHAPQEGVQNA